MIVLLGNRDAIETVTQDGQEARVHAPGDRITEYRFPEDTDLREAFNTIVASLGYHIAPGAKPVWIDTDSPGLKDVLVDYFGFDLKVQPETGRRPPGWGREVSKRTSVLTAPAMLLWSVLLYLAVSMHITTNAGVDLLSRLLGDTSSNGTGAYAPANWMGVTANSATPLVTDVALAGEIVGGTLARAQAVYAHTNGTASFTLTKAFTSDQTVTLAKLGLFNASTSGTMAQSALLSSPATLVSGDSVTLTTLVTF